MENNIRFRNHFSIILPNLKGLIWLLILAVLGIISGEGILEALWPLGLSAIIVLWQAILWAKTWIIIENQSLIIECNTVLSKRKNVIGIANISNVNLNQGLLAMMLGTCELKLDTNSLSTADTTDVRIVLKKHEAEALREFLLKRVENEEAKETETFIVVDEAVEPETSENIKKMNVFTLLLHGVFSTRLLYTLLAPLYIVLELTAEFDAEIDKFLSKTSDVLGLVIIAVFAWLILVAVFALIKGVVKYWDFQIERIGNELFLQYGLMSKVNYSIPVDKIQALVLKQGLLARMCKQYAVEVVNVGMNDDKQEANAFLLPYCSRAKMEQHIGELLPEFASYLELNPQKQPQSVWSLWIVRMLICIGINAVICGLMVAFASEWVWLAVAISVGILVLMFLLQLLQYGTEGTCFGEQVLLSVTGIFSRKHCYMKYEKIQHVALKQNPVSKKYKIQRGTVSLLASMTNRVQEIPYFEEEKIEFLKRKL